MNIFCLRGMQYEHVFDKFGVKTTVHGLSRSGYTKSDLISFTTHFADTKPDFFFFLKDEQLTRKILNNLKQASPKTKFIMFYGDQRGGVPPLIGERVGLLDTLLINNEDPRQFKMYSDVRIPKVFTHHHGVPTDEFKDFDCSVTHDVFFGGNNFNHNKFPLSKFRYDFINRVYGLFNTVVYGNGWSFKTQRRVPRHVYARVLRTANLNLGMNHYGDIVRYYDRRLFECMASGRLHITYYVPGMEKDFENGKHLVWFKTQKEGLNVIQNYLKYPEKREVVAKAGKKLMFEHHSFEVRATQFVKILEQI